jgi:hypothetical protein
MHQVLLPQEALRQHVAARAVGRGLQRAAQRLGGRHHSHAHPAVSVLLEHPQPLPPLPLLLRQGQHKHTVEGRCPHRPL